MAKNFAKLAVACCLPCLAAAGAVNVDVLLAYDAGAARWLAANGRAEGEFAESCIARMNRPLPLTDLDRYFSFRLAGTVTVAAEASGDDESMRLQNTLFGICDGMDAAALPQWKAIHDARDSLGADLVILLASSPSGRPADVCGVSWGLGRNGERTVAEFAPYAYSVCYIQNVETSDILVHEAAHNMGAGHHELQDIDTGPGNQGPQFFPYSAAWYFKGADGIPYYTVMGYPRLMAGGRDHKECGAFSSSIHTYAGAPLGDATHDNTRTLRETCAAVSAYRDAPGEPAPAFAAKTSATGALYGRDGSLAGIVQITVSKTDGKGLCKISGTVTGPDGKKMAARGVKVRAGRSGGNAIASADLAVKGSSETLRVSVASDGSIYGSFGDATLETAQTGTPGSTSGTVFTDLAVVSVNGVPVLDEAAAGVYLQPCHGVPFAISRGKWTFPKNAAVKYARNGDGSYSLSTEGGKNYSSMKLKLTAKTGVFKGAFTLYANSGTEARPKLKKFKMKVSGIAANDTGEGTATLKKPQMSFDIHLRGSGAANR